MIIYSIIPLILLIMSLIELKDKKLEKLAYLMVGIFLCTSYFNGTDWRQYEIMYNDAKWNSIWNFYAEKGFYIYMLLFKTLHFDFFNFFIVTKLLVFYIFYKKLSKYECNQYFVLSLFYVITGLYLFIDCPFRNLIGIGVSYIAFDRLEKDKWIQFILLILLAGTFHSSLLFLSVFVIVKPSIDIFFKIDRKIIVASLGIIWILLSSQNILISLLKNLPLFSVRLSSYLGTEYSIGKIISFGSIEKIFFIVMIIIFRDNIFKEKKDKYLFVYIMAYFIFYRIALSFPILSRFTYFFQIFYFIGISKLLMICNDKIYKLGIIGLFIYQILILNRSITQTYRYLPYTSYFEYIFKEKPSYEYRDMYNKLEYWKRVGEKVPLK